MKKRSSKSLSSLPPVHGKMVERLAGHLKPVQTLPPLSIQWALWAFFASIFLVAFLLVFHLRPDLGVGPCSLVFNLLGAALAARAALEAGTPGEEKRGKWKFWAACGIWLGSFLAACFILPWQWQLYLPPFACNTCYALVGVTGLLSGGVLVFFLKRNAPLRTFRAGLWAGFSSFLLGLTAISLHCPSGNLFHVGLEHFLPVLLYSLLVAGLAQGWLSAWKRGSLEKQNLSHKSSNDLK